MPDESHGQDTPLEKGKTREAWGTQVEEGARGLALSLNRWRERWGEGLMFARGDAWAEAEERVQGPSFRLV